MAKSPAKCPENLVTMHVSRLRGWRHGSDWAIIAPWRSLLGSDIIRRSALMGRALQPLRSECIWLAGSSCPRNVLHRQRRALFVFGGRAFQCAWSAYSTQSLYDATLACMHNTRAESGSPLVYSASLATQSNQDPSKVSQEPAGFHHHRMAAAQFPGRIARRERTSAVNVRNLIGYEKKCP